METKDTIDVIVYSPSKAHNLRKGRGFSLAEIREAGKPIQLLKKLNIPIDYIRQSTHKENVEKLKKLKISEEKGKKRKPYIFKEKKRTPFKSEVKKPAKRIVKKQVAVKKVTPKKKVKSVKKEKVEKAAKVEKEKVEVKGTPLTSLPGLGPSTEKKFGELGVKTIEDLLKEDPQELSTLIKGVSEERIQNWIEEAKKLLKS